MTLISANDRFEILDLCSRYNRCIDNGEEDALMDCWVKSGLSFESPKGKFTNWDQLRKHFAKELHGGSLSGKRQVLFNVVVREGADVDHAFVDSEYIIIDTQTLMVIETGAFKNDKVIRTSMGWSFQSRTQKIDKSLQPKTQPQPAEVHPN